jgi:hypothetical protein
MIRWLQKIQYRDSLKLGSMGKGPAAGVGNDMPAGADGQLPLPQSRPLPADPFMQLQTLSRTESTGQAPARPSGSPDSGPGYCIPRLSGAAARLAV